MSSNFYEMYLEELSAIEPCDEAEEKKILADMLAGEMSGSSRLIEGNLHKALNMAKTYENKGVLINDLVQEANTALTVAVTMFARIRAGKTDSAAVRAGFVEYMEAEITKALEEAVALQKKENEIEEMTAARVNVLKDVSAALAEELGREATVEELAVKMKMTEQEIKDIMKLTLDAMSATAD